MLRKTKIVSTIGPASEKPEILKELIDAGMDVARLNFSHGDFEEHGSRIENIRKASKEAGKTVAILLDTKGPEIRTGDMAEKEVYLKRDSTLYVSMTPVAGNEERISVTYPGLIDDVHKGSKILLDDGLIELLVEEIDKENNEIKTTVLNNGPIKSKKGVNVPNVSVNLPGMTDKDAKDIEFGVEQGVDFIAASFVRRASDVLEIKELLERKNASDVQIIPKIENQEGVDNIEAILKVSDGLMVARGDLGVEIPAEDVPLVQKQLIRKCNQAGKPVITATQMLDSMQHNPRPTRAEASDVANAIFDGTDAIMLSGETAAGDYPVASVQTMANIAKKTETGLDYASILSERSKHTTMTITDAISQSVTHTAINLDVNAIITPTESGHTARMVSKYRSQSPILAVTSSEKVNRKLSLVWGVHALMGERAASTDEMLETAIEKGIDSGLVEHGDRVIITAGVPVGESGTTNLMKVHVIGNVLTNGQGIGQVSASGRAVVAENAKDANARVEEGDILVTFGTDKEMMPAIEKAKGLVTVEGGLTSHAAVVGLSLGIPVIVGTDEALEKIEDYTDITIDGAQGKIYKGHTGIL
ncbi:pyruvate kinase [Salimicrobium jeotgali]|uniref:Pyruvate kinase n=1 Tax=Salimicrobium jeotgali TaxID=1230341 RepID=K2G962_9BACI|nr:pyruvate kinase [Salimicrobium jeotgali]AKG04143.1 pyruvate kinase [Salimicrobium jeotgali]EKE30937.1 pyruvate kinase [Salimicrobium jeotgali]MBM7697402.1 pyruvate kinase [Salimicrobium jeotgali]